MIPIAIILVIISFIFCMMGLVLVLVFHWRLLVQEKNEKNLKNKWIPVLAKQVAGSVVETLPSISEKEKYDVLLLWNATQAQLRGQANESLNFLAKKLGLDELALNESHYHRGHRHWHAAIALGYLKDPRGIPFLKPLLGDSSPVLSLLAARSFMQIDSEKCLKEMAPLLKIRKDWSRPRVATILDLASTQQLSANIDPVSLDKFHRAKIS